ncbi:unnamed protein product [Allacma fusca]|uniref:Vacuolar protein n=1 Tax=Allacma fusca TaxID=39272 RepID=A0A8J2P7C5_9HEXA|nr:unnamed protein product [Allacma fusca]
MAFKCPPVPQSLKALNHYLKVASEHETRDPVVAYWARFYAVQLGLTIDKSSPEAKMLLFSIVDWLEKRKKELNDEAINTEAVGEAHIENYAVKIFSWADGQERNSVHNKNVVKAFYSAGILFDILSNFTKELSEDFEKMRKYAKWRAAYIHNCLKNGEVPEVPAETSYDYDEGAQDLVGPDAGQGTSQGGWNFPPPAAPPQVSSPTQPPDNNYFAPLQPQPQIPAQTPQSSYIPFEIPAASVSTSALPVETITKAQKYCKWASSALNFDDVPTAIVNLRKALVLLQTGEELQE